MLYNNIVFLSDNLELFMWEATKFIGTGEI